MSPLFTSNSNFNLSYDASNILGENDKSLFLHKRPLLNADNMVKKGHFKSALEIYYRAVSKISNPTIQKKIQKNISDIHEYLKESDPDSEKAFLEKYSDNKEKEFSQSLKELSNNLSDTLSEKLNILKQIDKIPEEGTETPAPTPKLESDKIKDSSEIKPLDFDSKKKTEEVEDQDLEEIEGTLQFENESEKEIEKPSSTSLPSNKEKEKKPKKANIKIDKDAIVEGLDINTENIELGGGSITIENANIQTGTSESNKSVSNTLLPENLDKEAIDYKEENALPTKGEKKKSEEIRIVKEYVESFETQSSEKESVQNNTNLDSSEYSDQPEDTKTTKSKSNKEKKQPFPSENESSIDDSSNKIDENADSKSLTDNAYSPQMKFYEAGNIEIPEATEIITSEFKSEEFKSEEIRKAEEKKKRPSQSNSGDFPNQEGGMPNGNQGESYQSRNAGEQQAYNVPPLPPPLPLNINDWLSNLYFSKEWEKFKPLPLKDRRSGKDRRTSENNKLPRGIKNNRRSGIERRNHSNDLIGEREDFLKDWNKDNKTIPSELSQMISSNASSTGSPVTGSENPDSSFQNIEFLPRDPSYKDSLPASDDLLKVDLPDPEEIIIKPPIDQDEITKEPVSKDITDTLTKYVPANEELGLSESDKGLVKIDLPDPITQKADSQLELPQREVSGEIEVSSKDGTGIAGAANKESSLDTSGMGPFPYTPEAFQIPEELRIELPDPDDFIRTKSGHLIDPFAPEETPEINMIDGDGPLDSDMEDGPEISEIPELPPPPPEPERTIHGILELKPPEIDDAPFLTLTYDFSKIPHPFKLSKNYSIMEYSYYKYKPMLMKAQEFARRKMLKNALNYYRVIKSQNIPPELKNMINRNITDITEFLEKFIMSKGG